MTEVMKTWINVLIFVVFFLIGLYFFNKKDMSDWDIKSVPKTNVEISTKKIEVGNWMKDSVWQGKIDLKNTGKRPLVVYDVSTSCGCVQVEYSKRPVRIDSTGSLNIRVKSGHEGRFKQRFMVFCNTADSPIICTVSGEIKEN